ncbi:hypothetical protein Bphy_5264 [Paraburkholderia phymatum STM815]|uniref:Uncharacterized protein n=1 Tax=Paraburkholderia phymatum (strain DSM 17167 / CIP 108236 / LMG 21445 / STM815) TaxID=391038 RepID=B2JMV1_PARP8|nr:hypothetical protein Bphy_5264 [Paraburkholderia phymatum STM815]
MGRKADLFSLRVADQHIALAQGLVEHQLSTVHMLETRGRDATEAKLLLAGLENSLEALVDQRSTIERTIRISARRGGGGPS